MKRLTTILIVCLAITTPHLALASTPAEQPMAWGEMFSARADRLDREQALRQQLIRGARLSTLDPHQDLARELADEVEDIHQLLWATSDSAARRMLRILLDEADAQLDRVSDYITLLRVSSRYYRSIH